MNELIYDLWLKFINNELLFAGVIQTACKAQRNACKREYLHSVRELNTTKINDLANDINSAEITEQDYE